MLMIEYLSHYICNQFKWSELVGPASSSHEHKTSAQKEYLKHITMVRRFETSECVALFKKLKRHEKSAYWNHYLLFRHFLTQEQQTDLLNELLLEEDPQDAKALIEEMGKWSPDFQRQFLGHLDTTLRNKLFKAFGPTQLIELTISLTSAIHDHPHVFCERLT
jgi:hypothetical protein